LKLFKD
jgi:hypothetical protein